MKNNKNKLTNFFPRNIVFYVTVVFAFFDSLVLKGDVNIFAIFLLFLYFVLTYKDMQSRQCTFALSTVLILCAVLLFQTEGGSYIYEPVKKLSEWSFLMMVVGLIKLGTEIKNVGKN